MTFSFFNSVACLSKKVAHVCYKIYNFEMNSNEHGGGGPRGVMVKAMDCGIIVGKFVLQFSYMFPFGQIPLGKV